MVNPQQPGARHRQKVNQWRKITAMAKYVVPDKERHLWHLELVRKEFDQKTGKPLFKPFIQKFTPDEKKMIEDHPGGYTILTVLHDPTKEEATGDLPETGKK